MSTWASCPLGGHIDQVTVRKGKAPVDILSLTSAAGFVRSLDVFDKQVFSADTSSYKLVSHDDIAYNPSRINVGSVARCHLPDGGAVSPMYVVVRCRPTLSPRYLLHFLRSRIGRRHVARRCLGAVRLVLRYGDLEKIDMPLPPRAEQERIVQILDEAQSLRELRLRADGRQLQLRSALLQRILAEEDTARMKSTPLFDLVDKERGISYGVVQRGDDTPQGVPLIRITDFSENALEPRNMVRVPPELSTRHSRTVLEGGEVLVSIRGTVGRVAVVPDWAVGWNVAREVAVVPLLPSVSRCLVYSYLLSSEAQRFILGEIRGVAQSGINLEDLRRVSVPDLSREGRQRLEQAMNDVEHICAAQAGARERLDDLMESLLCQAFQGQL